MFWDRLRDDSDFLRVRIRAEGGTVVRFAIQYEAVVESQTYSILRYDSAHGQAHWDTLAWDGTVADKEWIVGKSYAQVVTESIEDIRTNWPAYRDAFLRRRP